MIFAIHMNYQEKDAIYENSVHGMTSALQLSFSLLAYFSSLLLAAIKFDLSVENFRRLFLL